MATSRSACDMSAHAARADIGNTTRQFLERRSARDCLLHRHCIGTAQPPDSRTTKTETHCHLYRSVGSNLVPLKVSPKREFLRFWLETFGKFSPELPLFGGWRLTKTHVKPYKYWVFVHMHSLSLVERVAGWGGRYRTSEWRNPLPALIPSKPWGFFRDAA